jgi:hypothetical protein
MAHVRLLVPAALVSAVRETVVLLYQATAEALHLSLRARGEIDWQAEVHQHRARLAELDALLDRLGWTPAHQVRDVELGASADVLHDAVYGALIDAGERLVVACERGWRGERPAGVIQAAAREVIALDELLCRLDASASADH